MPVPGEELQTPEPAQLNTAAKDRGRILFRIEET